MADAVWNLSPVQKLKTSKTMWPSSSLASIYTPPENPKLGTRIYKVSPSMEDSPVDDFIEYDTPAIPNTCYYCGVQETGLPATSYVSALQYQGGLSNTPPGIFCRIHRDDSNDSIDLHVEYNISNNDVNEQTELYAYDQNEISLREMRRLRNLHDPDEQTSIKQVEEVMGTDCAHVDVDTPPPLPQTASANAATQIEEDSGYSMHQLEEEEEELTEGADLNQTVTKAQDLFPDDRSEC